jgi:pimeloyl-ACP methyl ester carboxylesterase
LNPDKDLKFWDFSFDEMGQHDLPATIDYITNLTKVEKLTYIGHSQGTSQMFVALTKNIEYFKSKLNGFVSLAPIVRFKNVKSSLVKFAANWNLDKLVRFFGVNELLNGPETYNPLLAYICKYASPICSAYMGLILDNLPVENDIRALRTFVGHIPAGSSLKCLSHYANNIRTGEFLEFDYGKEENMNRYGQETAPKYKLENIKRVPICMIVGKSDLLSDTEDSQWLKNELDKNNVVHFYKEYPLMGHSTFLVPKYDEFLKDIFKCVDDFN